MGFLQVMIEDNMPLFIRAPMTPANSNLILAFAFGDKGGAN
jgi:hypothetical protein